MVPTMMGQKSFLMAFAVSFGALVAPSVHAQNIVDRPPHLDCRFAFFGQSNAVGRAKLPASGVRISQHPGMSFVFTLGNKWAQAFDPIGSTDAKWGGRRYPVAFPVDKKAGIGSAIYFANIFTTATHKKIGIIGGGVGSTSMVQQAKSTSTTTIYGADRDRLIRTKQYGPLCAIVWWQGESDAETFEDANKWAQRFAVLAQAWRSDNGDVPIIMVRLNGQNPNPKAFPYWSLVRAKQEMAVRLVPNVILVSSNDAEMQPRPSPHYTAAGYGLIAQRMFDRYADWVAEHR